MPNMAPHHFILILLAVVGLPTLLTLFSLLHTHPRGNVATEVNSDVPKSGVRALFSFHTPSTLFPPSAIISLTDDNSTFFLSRPADFGPSLSANGLSGQLWIGTGFGDDGMGRGAGTGAEGELGCSDVPGWDNDKQKHHRDGNTDQGVAAHKNSGVGKSEAVAGQSNAGTLIESLNDDDGDLSEGDGTDDHLHHPLPTSPVSKPPRPGQAAQYQPAENGQQPTHADIQSLQESAEISDKIVLLSRGGCGFLEKVKWAQRRGAKALIVGDHTRGGALITMYARGDTSNVTIPALFTSHTTAHLLSSLIPPEDLAEGIELEGNVQGLNWEKQNLQDQVDDDRPTFTPVSIPRPTSKASKSSHGRHVKSAYNRPGSKQVEKQNWLKRLAVGLGLIQKTHEVSKLEDSRRPPSSGRLDWFSEKWMNESPKQREASLKSETKSQNQKSRGENEPIVGNQAGKASSHPGSSDDFVIGVQDWRDPDLVVAKSATSKTKSTTTVRSSEATPSASRGPGKSGESNEQKSGETFKGGSITPGSGQYLKPDHRDDANPQKAGNRGDEKQGKSSKNSGSPGKTTWPSTSHTNNEHEGLWVTLTPTTMSTSPFFDTLLVLVVSPLVTLTVVYALLLIRSRIRRRRWRAPKSVVDRLPIRTYHTMSCSSTTSSTRLPSPRTSSPTSPLLRSNSVSTAARPRPRSATASAIGDTVSASFNRATANISAEQQEKSTQTKKYKGRQIECVVCLEEYVDGQSQVMSLPCGHEFHVECM